MRSGIKKFKSKKLESKLRPSCALARQICRWQGFDPMKLAAIFCAAFLWAYCAAFAQTPAPDSAKPADAAQVEALAKKIDEQNAKIDALSQEILKLEQQLAHIRPGIMIGESSPSPGTSVAPAMSSSHPAAAG